MRTLKVEKATQKEIHFTNRGGKPDSFMKYSVLSENVWYDLKGVGKEIVAEGDTISGLYTEADWSKGGKSGVNRTLELVESEKNDTPEPEVATDLAGRVTALENAVFGSSKPEITTGSTDDSEDPLPF